MKRVSVLMVAAVGLMLIQFGCGSKEMAQTGFLTDYSRLRKESDTSLLNMNDRALARYSNFIVDRVEVHFHKGAKAIEERTKGKLTQQEINDLTSYMHSKIVEAVKASGNSVAYKPASGVARIRVALTDIDESTAASLLPQAKLAGVGIGGASMEAEIVDSMTGEQIGAIVQSKKGSRMPFANLDKWDATKQVIGDWAKRFQKRLE
jgi:hypothetical protein